MSNYEPDKHLADSVARMMRDHGETVSAVADYMRRGCYDAFLAADAHDLASLSSAKQRADAITTVVATFKNIADNADRINAYNKLRNAEPYE